MYKQLAAITLLATSIGATAQTIIYLEDGTTVTTDKDVYVSDVPLYTVTIADTITVEPVDKVEADTPECEGNQGLTFGGVAVECIPEEPEQQFTFGGY